jgi:hypothetical protein
LQDDFNVQMLHLFWLATLCQHLPNMQWMHCWQGVWVYGESTLKPCVACAGIRKARMVNLLYNRRRSERRAQ